MTTSNFWEITPRTEGTVFDQLLKNRQIGPQDLSKFINPTLSDLDDPLKLSGVREAKDRILTAIKNGEKIVIYGDYDVDGISATAVLWEAIDKLGGRVLPYIPDRFSEGYGINSEAIKKLAEDGTKLIISVDSGVTAFKEITLAKKLGIDFIITDHHTLPSELPPALAIVHTTSLAGVGVAYKLAQSLIPNPAIELVALGTIADIVPLTSENRILAKLGIEALKKTIRPGLLALYEEARLERKNIGAYEIGFMIGPRLNAMGRLEHALDSLRVLLTRDPVRARDLAKKLGETNEERRRQTIEMVSHARQSVTDSSKEKIWVVSDPSYAQGIIGLIAGRLTEEWGRPVIAISEGEEVSKGSARSITGFNLVQAIGEAKDLLLSFGGHPQAAGFTIATKNIPLFRQKLTEYASKNIKDEGLEKRLLIDAKITEDEATIELARKIETMSPFGPGNPNPLFAMTDLEVGEMRLLSENKHLRLGLGKFEAIGFGLGTRGSEIRPGMKIDAAFHLEINTWRERDKLQLKLRDFKVKS